MFKSRFFWIALILALVLAGIWFLLEGDLTPPKITLQKKIEFIGQNQEIEFSVEDQKSGTMFVQVLIKQDSIEKNVSRFAFPTKGIHRKNLKLTIKPKSLGIKDGKATMIISAKDYSIFDNETRLEKEFIIDTQPPRIEMSSLNHYISMGGSCMATYNVSKDALKSGVIAGDLFFKGYPVAPNGAYVAYFALPWTASTSTPIMLMAQDSAGNIAKVSFHHSVLKKRFKKDKINISDRFLNKKMPEFSARYDNLKGRNIDIFLQINRELRKENNLKIKAICNQPHTKKLWEGPFLRMQGSPKAQFADTRTYYYKGKAVDKQVHMGVDIAALKQFPVKTANNGMVVFADYLGIYGNTIIIDHGQGLFSMYSHLSGFRVKSGIEVKKGNLIGNTGATGLAGGDHLHFSIILHGVFVNPKEWWDSHWIKDNITAKLRPDKSK